MLSMIIPTYNERENIRPPVTRLSRVLGGLDVGSEVIIVDDDSPDRTWEVARELGRGLSLRVIRRPYRRGLSSAIIEGLRAAMGGVIRVMDADLSHPPEAIPEMLECISGHDVVVASRYATGGRVMDWPVSRRAVSVIGRLLARPLIAVRDPMSGFFLVRRAVVGDLIEDIGFRPRGFKILLDLMVRYKECGRGALQVLVQEGRQKQDGSWCGLELCMPCGRPLYI